MVVVMAAGLRRLVAPLRPPDIEPFDQTVVGECLERTIDAGPTDAAAATAQRDIDVLRAQGARLGRQQVDDLVACTATAVAGVLQDGAGVGTPTGIVDRHVPQRS